MDEANLVDIPTPTMRAGVLEPLEQLGRDNCLSLQAVIVKNGKIFIDSIDAVDEGANDENRLLEDEIDSLTGGVDDDYIDSNKFSQEAFDSFMRANDSDEDIIDNIDELRHAVDDNDQANGDVEFQYQDYIKYEYHTDDSFHDSSDISGSHFHNGSLYTLHGDDHMTLNMDYPAYSSGHQRVSGSGKVGKCMGHHCRRDSLNMEEYSTWSEDVSLLLSEDLDTSWRYVPLYPENYYSSGEEEQRVSIITDLPNLLRDNKAECMRRVVPKVMEVLQVVDIDMQLAAATTFLQILEKDLVTVDEYKSTFLQTILTSVDSNNEDVANAWLETLLECIDILPAEVVKKDILSIAVNKGQLCQSVQARLSCCKILGKVSSVFENIVIKNDILPVALSLCGDSECDVRACMCQRLDIVAHGLGLELTKSKILPQLIELSEDDSQKVICTCLETTANLIGMLDREANANAIVPMVKELLEKALNSVDVTLPVASRLIGRLCHSLLEYMTVEDKRYFLEYFKKLCTVDAQEKTPHDDSPAELLETTAVCETRKCTGFETRQNAAYNMPSKKNNSSSKLLEKAMVVFLEAKLFHIELYSCFGQLCRDPFVPVQKTIAAGFHEIAKLLGTRVDIVFPELKLLLSSTDFEVLKAIIPNFMDIMSPVAALGVDRFMEHMTCAVEDVVTHFLKAENIVFSSPCWRTQEAMMQSMQSLHHLCRNEYIYQRVIPLLFDKLRTGRALPVKVAAAMTVTMLCRHLRYKAQRDEVVLTLIDEFSQSKSCYRRSLFIDLARCYLHVNSKKAFKEHFFNHLVKMMYDQVVTVRLKVLTIFLDMKRSLTLPDDENLHVALESSLQHMITHDRDSDIQHSAYKISEELDASHCRGENIILDNKTLTTEEEEDSKKEDEEKNILAREENERREEETRVIKCTDKRNSLSGVKKDTQSKIPGTKKNTSLLKASSFGGTKRDDLHQPSSKMDTITVVTTSSSTAKAVNGIPLQKQRILCLTKSKSTTCIPSLIPRLEQRPSTPPKKEFVRRIPVLISNKTVSAPVLTGSSVSKKCMSPTPSKKSQLNFAAQASAISTRNGSSSNHSPVKHIQGQVGSVNVTSSPDISTKAKALPTAVKLNNTMIGVATRVPKKLTK